MDTETADEFTSSDAVRVLGIALFRREYQEQPGELPSNGTMGEFAFEDAVNTMRRTPGLRYVLEAGIRAVQGDPLWDPWLITLYAGGADDCATAEEALAATLAPDPEPPPGAMTPDEIATAMIADLHDRYDVPVADR